MNKHEFLTVTRTQWAVGQGFFHSGALYAGGKPFIYVFDCGAKGNTKANSDTTKHRIQTEIHEFTESLKGYWFPRYNPYWKHWQDVHYPPQELYDPGAIFIGTPFKDEQILFSKKQKSTKPSVDIVYISHFDNDHINGLCHLLDKTSIKEISIPYASAAKRFIDLLSSISDEDGTLQTTAMRNIGDFTLQFIANPTIALANRSADTTLREVGNRDRDSVTYIHPTHNSQTDGYDLNPDPFQVASTKPLWTLFTHSLKGDSHNIEHSFKKALIEEIRKIQEQDDPNSNPIETIITITREDSSNNTSLDEEFLDQIDFSNYETLRLLLNRKYLGAIKKAYRRALNKGASLNITSLILYSGPPLSPYNFKTCHTYWRGDKTLNNDRPGSYRVNTSFVSPPCGWIGCGDAPIGQNPQYLTEFNRVFETFKTETRTFAPPHHGSESDWSDKLLDGFGFEGNEAPICVFSANSLQFSHPSTKAILSANSIGSPTIVVTNDARSRFTETIEIITQFD